MAPKLVFKWFDKRVNAAGEGHDIIKGIRSFDSVAYEAEEKLGLHPGSYEFFDSYGKVETPEDLQRAMKLCDDKDECVLEIRELKHFMRIRELQEENTEQHTRIQKLEGMLRSADKATDQKIEAAKEAMRQLIKKTDSKIEDNIGPAVEDLLKFKSEQTRISLKMQQKLAGIDLEELRRMSIEAKDLRDETKLTTKRMERMDTDFHLLKTQVGNDVANCLKELKDLHRYIQGKIDMLIETDADLRRDVQLLTERLALAQDDHRLLQEELKRLTNQCAGALEESEELRDLLGKVREDNKYIKSETGAVITRVNCIEGQATAEWSGFSPGVLYFRHWHRIAKGNDVQLNSDLTIATGRGFMAATGVVLGSDEGMVVADGPCRRFGTPGYFSSYFEIEIDEICAAPQGAGGLYVGFAIQSGQEIAEHPKNEFDGWLMGGESKALISRRGMYDMEVDPTKLPETFQPAGVSTGAVDAMLENLAILRASLPIRAKGETRAIVSSWNSSGLVMGDRVGALFRCKRDGGATMKVCVNGMVKAQHEFQEAPPAEAVGFMTPIIRLAGTGKAAKLHAGLMPNSKILSDDQ